MTEFERLQSHVLFVDRVIIELLQKVNDMSNLDDLKAKISEAVAGIKSRDDMIASLQAQIAASASDDAALPALMAELDSALHPQPSSAPEVAVEPVAEQPAA